MFMGLFLGRGGGLDSCRAVIIPALALQLVLKALWRSPKQLMYREKVWMYLNPPEQDLKGLSLAKLVCVPTRSEFLLAEGSLVAIFMAFDSLGVGGLNQVGAEAAKLFRNGKAASS